MRGSCITPYQALWCLRVADRPTPAEIASAKALVEDEMLGDFPFTGPAEKAHAMAMLLLGFFRSMISGPTPLHLIEKPSPGTGATLMMDAISTVLTGVGVSVMTEGSSEEEWRKRLTSQLRRSPLLIVIDNLRRPLNSSALAAALTAPYWEDRILGVSEIVRLPIQSLWVATGNNPVLSNEMARRVVRIRPGCRRRPALAPGKLPTPRSSGLGSAPPRRPGSCLPRALPGMDCRW